MVQARQISVFSAATLTGRFNGAEIALIAVQNMIARYESADGRPGWVFSIDREAGALNSVRDLYAHAFVLFALAWAIRLEQRQAFFDAADRTLQFLDAQLSDPTAGGFWDSLPRLDNLRRQNPHMHLFEAFIALYEATGDPKFLERGRKLRNLAVERFLSANDGALREFFFDDWTVSPANGQGSVEPGHLFEWSWLLHQYQSASGEEQSESIAAMMRLARQSGLDEATGRIVDEIAEDGSIIAYTSRSWPHAEALKALTTIASDHGGGGDLAVAMILRRLMTRYCPPSLKGGWHDQMDADDNPIRPNIPASTLYHLYFGITAVEEFLRTP